MPCADMQQNDVMAMMVSIQRRLDHLSDGDRERQFFSYALRYLTTASGRQVEMENWMITSYEVEFGRQIGSGGLYVLYCSLSHFLRISSEFTHSGKVFIGTWNKTQVAIKVLINGPGVAPSSEVSQCFPLIGDLFGIDIIHGRPFVGKSG
jgi:hypothetical protein